MSTIATRPRRTVLIVAAAMALAAALLYPIAGAAPALAGPPPGSGNMLADFEGPASPPGFFVFNGGSSVVTTPIAVADTDPLVRPNQTGDIGALQVDYNVFDFGGFGAAFELTGGPQDWSQTAGLSFWFYGTASGLTYQAEISENRSDPNTDTSERFDYSFTDTTAGWQEITIPWGAFTRATDFQPGGAPNDGFTLTEVWAWAIVLPNGTDTVYFDDVALEPIVVDDFESGLPVGVDSDGVPVGFSTFQGTASVAISIGSPPAQPLSTGATSAIQVDLDVTDFAGFIHRFENSTLDAWVPQDWSQSEAFSFWFHGNNSGTAMFIDILENRNPGSTSDDAERWRYDLVDDFTGWKYFEIPFSDFGYFGVGNGAPNDGAFDRFEVHGWAFGTLGTGGLQTYYIDDVALVGIAGLPELSVGFDANSFDITEGATGDIVVALNRPLGDEDPDEVSVDYSVETIVAEAGKDFVAVTPGTLTFVKGGPKDLSFPITTIDDDKYEPTERLILRLANITGAAAGATQAAANIVDDDPFDPLFLDDFESFPYLWGTQDAVTLDSVPFGGAALAAAAAPVAGEQVLTANVPLHVDIAVMGNACSTRRGNVPVYLLTTDDFDATTVDHTTVRFGAASEVHAKNGVATRHVEDVDGDGDMDLVFHFERQAAAISCDGSAPAFNGSTYDGQPITAGGSEARFGRDFAIGQDWSGIESLTFWWYGQATGDEITLDVLDNRAPDPGPSGWETVWIDEFEGPAGAAPDPANWGYELGDGTVNGIPGWGNSELQYYTDSPDNAATDGNGNLVITAAEADGSLDCYYGACEYTSARLVTTKRAEFAYGRIEARVLVPDGGDGLWPAFWSLGTDIDLVDWPQTGEIDIMEYVSRVPDEIFGTIHGPGYSGGDAYGDTFPFPGGVSTDYHTFAIEWQPDLIEWYVDGNLYHSATPADVAPNPWVFNDPVYLLLNMAIGGNFGGPVGADTTFPQEMKIDYVKVDQAPDTAERFEATFVDDFAGWQLVEVPLASLVRSAEQPAGAPDDGLTLDEVWGYGFSLPDTGSSVPDVFLDQVRLVPAPVTVTSSADDGPGSLRAALDEVADGGTVVLDPALAGTTIDLTSGPLVFDRSVTVDGSSAPGVAIDAGGADRVVIVNPGAEVTISDLTMQNGYGFQLAGCVLNNGDLTLSGVTVTACVMTTPSGDFWQGGGAIYSGDGASLTLVDSTVANNTAQWSGGGVYSFFNTTTTIERSTISGNVSNDVGGALRSLGNVTITNSTISGNESTGWYGGAVFITDGVVDMTNVTIKDNVSPGFAPAGVFVGTFGPSSATLNVVNTIIEDSCFLAPFGAGPVAINSLGNNLFSDGSCFPVGTDIIGPTMLDALADNGGPTLTHALLAGSPAIDGANDAVCPATDQRGVARLAPCDIGAFEFVP